MQFSHRAKHRVIGSLLSALAVMACGRDLPSTPDNAQLITVAGRVTGLGPGTVVEGATVCIDGIVECVVSDENGEYMLANVSSSKELTLRIDLNDHLGATVPLFPSSDGNIPPVALIPNAIVDVQYSLVNESRDENRGLVAFSISNGIAGDGINVPDIVVGLQPVSGRGPFYSNAEGLPDQNLMKTSSNGGGVFINVEPASYVIQYGDLPNGCVSRLGWGDAASQRMTVEAGRVTVVRIECAVVAPSAAAN